MAQDLIITIFSNPSQKQLNSVGVGALSPSDVHPWSKLKRTPDLVDIGKGEAGHVRPSGSTGAYCNTGDVWGGFCFDAVAAKYREAGDGSMIRGMLKLKGKDPKAYEGGRIAIVTFSAGSTMARHLLDSDVDRNLVDTLISLDSMSFPKTNAGIQPWQGYFEFAKKATGMDRMTGGGRNPYLGPMMVVMNTSIASNSASASSTKEAIEYLYKQLNGPYYSALNRVGQAAVNAQAAAQKEIIARVKEAVRSLPLPMTIGTTQKKTYTVESATPSTWGYLGNLWQLGYPGKQASDHFFAAYVAQKFVIESFLIPRWNSGDVAVAGLGGLGASPGDAIREALLTFTTPSAWGRGGGLVNSGALGPAIMPGKVKVALGLGAGVAAGYALSKWLKL
jgi:hypothetical protein